MYSGENGLTPSLIARPKYTDPPYRDDDRPNRDASGGAGAGDGGPGKGADAGGGELLSLERAEDGERSEKGDAGGGGWSTVEDGEGGTGRQDLLASLFCGGVDWLDACSKTWVSAML